MMAHFKERHPNECVSADTEIEIKNINLKEDDRYMYLTSHSKMLFTITLKIDTLQKMAYWVVQHIGSKKVAQQHVYDIQVTSKKDSRRKVVFTEHCFNDTLKADEVFRLAKCGMLPVSALEHFVNDRTMSFRFSIRRFTNMPNDVKNEGGKNETHQNKGPKGPKGPQRPQPHVGQGPGPNTAKGPGPKKFHKPQSN